MLSKLFEERPISKSERQSGVFSLRYFKGLASLGRRHAQAFCYVVAVLLPIIVRTGTRPVIFTKHSGIGDIICTFPAALELKKRHPKAKFIYNCYEDYVCLPRLGGVADHVTAFQEIGLVGYWYRFLLSGYYLFGSDDDDPHSTPTEVYIKDFGRRFGVALDGSHPRLQIEPAVLAKMKALLQDHHLPPGPMIILHPGPSWPVREWPHEHWISLVEELRRKGFTTMIQLGIGKTLRFGAIEISPLPGVFPLVNQLSLEESIALISLADLFIGIDSGLLHIAASLRICAVGLWGPTSPYLRFSSSSTQSPVIGMVECRGCQHRFPRLHWFTGCPYDIKCMKSIEVEEVLQACLKRMEPATQVDS
jgi:ADP-heptose:LPS heptosyltransferase